MVVDAASYKNWFIMTSYMVSSAWSLYLPAEGEPWHIPSDFQGFPARLSLQYELLRLLNTETMPHILHARHDHRFHQERISSISSPLSKVVTTFFVLGKIHRSAEQRKGDGICLTLKRR